MRRALPAAVACTAAAAVLAGCSASGQSDSATKNAADTTVTASPGASPAAPDTGSAEAAGELPAGITPAAAEALCTSLGDQLQSMRTYTITPGKVTLNGVVVTWAAQNGVNLVDLAQNRGKIDQTLTVSCPDVHDGVTSALEVPDVASALVGF
ncbi:hypothetical protein FO059_12140 [Tomitella fengzijianii]|uniref:Lipoprotein n=1 Tax=Tomitella fengzijianii TaxID=2597660 RepID=A0A516X8B7_9ACTN|nr:hypothetical protein FO059_12140 [Tomitella fengzijianii]